MKIFTKLTLNLLLIAGGILLIFPVQFFPAFYDVRYMGIAAFVGAAVIYCVPRLLRVPQSSLNADKKNQAVDLLQVLLSIAIISNALGDLGFYQLYKIGFEFDKLIHFFIPLAGTIILPLFLYGRFEIHHSSAILLTGAIALGCGIGWEVYEYTVDHFFQTHIYGNYGSDLNTDTKFDLMFDALGILLGIGTSIFIQKSHALHDLHTRMR